MRSLISWKYVNTSFKRYTFSLNSHVLNSINRARLVIITQDQVYKSRQFYHIFCYEKQRKSKIQETGPFLLTEHARKKTNLKLTSCNESKCTCMICGIFVKTQNKTKRKSYIVITYTTMNTLAGWGRGERTVEC